ncbi:type VI secretion system contractile sheath small subunit [Poseidonocella sp. HB161398]|uniref:type VI secretion system contractile sheath small subunit n=1 Tax=Poseidonocella sp. HB161398 TaxID=2320855 RepID=UPI00110915FA|nr:type VI secretion system contractile sheath small subunit [Poseidonocella sp. HB161398]
MAKQSSQKFIARNRAPRVHIEYEVETYGAQQKVELPFVMGVLSDLAGRSHDLLPDLAQRDMAEIDIDTFDDRMRALKPRVAMQVKNTLTGEETLPVDLTFESIEDFSPAAVARKVDSLSRLLSARSQLANLLTYMDGKSAAETLVAGLLADPELLRLLTQDPAAAPADGREEGDASETEQSA